MKRMAKAEWPKKLAHFFGAVAQKMGMCALVFDNSWPEIAILKLARNVHFARLRRASRAA